jgi:hypothetical protein
LFISTLSEFNANRASRPAPPPRPRAAMAASSASAPGGVDEAAWVEMMLASEGPLSMEQARHALAPRSVRAHARTRLRPASGSRVAHHDATLLRGACTAPRVQLVRLRSALRRCVA